MAAAVKFKLPLPPSTNNLFRNGPPLSPYGRQPGSKRARFKTEAYKTWAAEAAQMVMIQRINQPNIRGRYRIEMVFERCKADLGNLEKAASDLMVDMGIVEDDSLCQEIVLRWGDVQGVEVTIEAV